MVQPASHLPAILGIEAGEVVAVVDLLEVPLGKAGHEAHLEIRRRIGILVGRAADFVGWSYPNAEAAVRRCTRLCTLNLLSSMCPPKAKLWVPFTQCRSSLKV